MAVVVGKVVIHGNATARVPRSFHAALHVLKTSSAASHGGRHAHVGSRDGGQGIELVVRARQRPFHLPTFAALVQHIKGFAGRSALKSPHRCCQSCRTSLQQPVFSTRARLSSSPLTTTRPEGGTVRTRWRELALDRRWSSKMSAWSNPYRLLSTAVRGGSARTCCACRRRRCRIHRPQSQSAALRCCAGAGTVAGPRPAGQRCQFSGTPPIKKPGCNPALPESRSASTWWSSARACVRHRQHGGPAHARPAIGAALCRAGPHPEWPIRGNWAAIGQPRTADHVAHHKHIRLQHELVGAKAFDRLNAQARSWSLMGGYIPASQPVTLCSASRARAARPTP